MNRILLELGTEEVNLVRLRDNRDLDSETIHELVGTLSRLEILGRGVTRHGSDFATYLDQHAPETRALPRYIVRIRTGNRETFRYLHNDEERAAFHEEYSLADADSSDTLVKEVENDSGVLVQQRISLHEIYESTQLTKLLNELAETGMDVNRFTHSEDARYHVIENRGVEKKETVHELHSIIDLIETLRKIGRRGLSIQRYKGLGEMNQSETTLPDHNVSDDPQLAQGKYRRCRRRRWNILHVDGRRCAVPPGVY